MSKSFSVTDYKDALSLAHIALGAVISNQDFQKAVFADTSREKELKQKRQEQTDNLVQHAMRLIESMFRSEKMPLDKHNEA